MAFIAQLNHMQDPSYRLQVYNLIEYLRLIGVYLFGPE